MADLISDLSVLIPAILAGLVVGLLAHEAGHCAGALLASIPIKRMRIGTGPVVCCTRLGKVELELRALPIGGVVQVEFDAQTTRPGVAVFVLGGAAANAALLGLRGGCDTPTSRLRCPTPQPPDSPSPSSVTSPAPSCRTGSG